MSNPCAISVWLHRVELGRFDEAEGDGGGPPITARLWVYLSTEIIRRLNTALPAFADHDGNTLFAVFFGGLPNVDPSFSTAAGLKRFDATS